MLGVLFFECQPNDINQYHSYTEQSELSSCISQSCLPTSCIPPWSKTGRFRNRPPARFAAPGGDFLVPRATFKRKTACWKTAKKKTFPNNDGNTAVFTAQHDFFCGCRGTSVWEIQGAVRLLSGFPLEKCGHWPQTTFQVVQGVPQKKNQNVPALWLLNYGNVAEIGATKMMFQNWSELAAQQATGTQPTELLSSDCFKLEPPP